MRITVLGVLVVIGGIWLLAIVINALARDPDGSNGNEYGSAATADMRLAHTKIVRLALQRA